MILSELNSRTGRLTLNFPRRLPLSDALHRAWAIPSPVPETAEGERSASSLASRFLWGQVMVLVVF